MKKSHVLGRKDTNWVRYTQTILTDKRMEVDVLTFIVDSPGLFSLLGRVSGVPNYVPTYGLVI